MSNATRLDPGEFLLITDYIERHCGIRITREKTYLLETRLTALMVENGCENFSRLHSCAVADRTNGLRDKIIDAMTTNETSWFRDSVPFAVLSEVLLGQKIAGGNRIRIWSAACSTGQEPYSIAMTVREFGRKNPGLRPAGVEIVATDISPKALYLAKAGRYDAVAMSRGLSDDVKERYFRRCGTVWAIDEAVKGMVTFRRFNLQDSFTGLGRFDIIFCRNVLIYFSDEFKRNVLGRLAALLRPGGYLLTGASESIYSYSNEYKMLWHGKGLFYQVI
jgi:chemotaxis protein methyltransferase CheR